jgi:hypothetical protein
MEGAAVSGYTPPSSSFLDFSSFVGPTPPLSEGSDGPQTFGKDTEEAVTSCVHVGNPLGATATALFGEAPGVRIDRSSKNSIPKKFQSKAANIPMLTTTTAAVMIISYNSYTPSLSLCSPAEFLLERMNNSRLADSVTYSFNQATVTGGLNQVT